MKFVRCLQGAIYDVIVDIRPDSPTYLHWHAEILSSDNMNIICAPEGFAHGFQTLEDNCEVIYFTTTYYAPDHEGGIRYNDSAIAIDWPMAVTGISKKDMSHPLLINGTIN
jgi:dTDP-4-dehydrorhamnose 3,5-epimerase